MKLLAHPRLLVSSERWQSLKSKKTKPLLQAASEIVEQQADEYLASRDLRYNRDLHNSLLLRAREVQCRVWTLLVRWGITGNAAFRAAAVDYIREMSSWEYWSWDRMREGNADPDADFDLSYGENSATVALAYDLLHATLSEKERAMFRELAVKWTFRPFLKTTQLPALAQQGWWFGAPNCNWNTVCAGGAGMLALAMYDEVPEAEEVLKRADASIAPYMNSLEETEGGWPEGIGYWNYGHRYAFLYLLSHEAATGAKHPLLEQKGASQTLEFPLDFCPHAQPCGFGDVNKWCPIAFHYAAAMRFNRTDLIGQLDAVLSRTKRSHEEAWPSSAELLLHHPDCTLDFEPGPHPIVKLYPITEWGILADRLPQPGLYLSVRGGTTEVPHSHLDLGSFHCVVGKERLIDNITVDGSDEYLDTTFSSRRYELFDMTPASKNVVLINGVGVSKPAQAESRLLEGKGWQAIRLDLSAAMGTTRGGKPAASFYARLFLMLQGEIALVLDRVTLESPGRLEARLHTYSKTEFGKTSVAIRGEKEELQVSFASSVPATLHRAEDALTTPSHQSTMIRWCTDTRTHREANFVTVLTPGREPASAFLEGHGGQLHVSIKCSKYTRTVKLSPDLLNAIVDRTP